MNTDRIAMISRPLRPTPTPPGLTSPSIMWLSATPPPSGVKLSCIELTEPFDVPVVDAAHRPDAAGPKRISLPSMFPPDWMEVVVWSAPSVVEPRVAVALEAHGPQRHAEPDDEHDGEHRSALAAVLDHVAERERERERDDEDRPRLDEVVETRRCSRTGATSSC